MGRPRAGWLRLTCDERVEHVQRGSLAPAAASYEWLFGFLVGETPLATWAAAGELPAGFERADRFAVFPAGAGRAFMVSLASRVGSASALTSYNALRPRKRRVARRILGMGMRTGLAQRLLCTIDIGKSASATPSQLAGAVLSEHLSGLFGQAPLVIAVGGSAGPYRKPVLQVFGTDGTPLGYVKIGWNGWTRDAVNREAAALSAYAARPSQLGVPALLGRSSWRGFDLVVTGPLPRQVRRLRTDSRLPDISVLREISALTPPYDAKLATSPWWRGIRARIQTGVADPRARAELQLIADRIEDSCAGTPLGFGAWHGDFVPWNLATLRGQTFAWDWESSASDAPIGFDAVHFHFQVAFVARRRPLVEAAAIAARDARPALGALGVAAGNHRLISRLHLVELFIRHEQARSAAGAADGRFYPDVARVLELGLADDFAVPRLSAAGRPA